MQKQKKKSPFYIWKTLQMWPGSDSESMVQRTIDPSMLTGICNVIDNWQTGTHKHIYVWRDQTILTFPKNLVPCECDEL